MDAATQAREDAEAEQQDLRALVAQRDEIVSLAVEAESGSYDAEVGARRLMSTKSSLERVLDKNASAIDGNNAAPALSLLSTVTSKLNSLITPTPTTAAAAAQSAAASRASPKAHDLAALMATDRLSHLHVAYDELQFDALLSKGAFADVHVGRFHEERVAIKMLNRPMVTADVGLFHREVQIMSRLRSDRLVQLCAVCVEQGRVCLVVQHMSHGSLSQVRMRVFIHVSSFAFVLLANSRTPLTFFLSFNAIAVLDEPTRRGANAVFRREVPPCDGHRTRCAVLAQPRHLASEPQRLQRLRFARTREDWRLWRRALVVAGT
jgi:hypothetical protein